MNIHKDDEIRAIFAKNLNAMLDNRDKSQIEVANTLGIKQSTFSSWCTGAKMPRMDKVQALADYFGVMKSDLIEDKQTLESSGTQSKQKATDDDIKFALFNGDVDEITDEMYEDVKRFAQFIKEKKNGKNSK